jgi:hypothetical protein
MEIHKISRLLASEHGISSVVITNNHLAFTTDIKGEYGFEEKTLVQLGEKFVVFEIDFIDPAAGTYGTTANITVFEKLSDIKTTKLVDFLLGNYFVPETDLSKDSLQNWLIDWSKSKKIEVYEWWLFDQILSACTNSASDGWPDPSTVPPIADMRHLCFVKKAIAAGIYPWEEVPTNTE